jgi:hypothetical protein
MKKFKFIILLVLITGNVTAGEISIDEDYMQVMEDRQKSLTSNIALQNATAALGDAKSLEDSFGEVEQYYDHKGNATDAVNWSKESRDLVASIRKFVSTKDFDSASQTSAVLAKNCKSCHRVYKKDTG